MKKAAFAEPLRHAIGANCVDGDTGPLDAIGVDKPRIAEDSDVCTFFREFLLKLLELYAISRGLGADRGRQDKRLQELNVQVESGEPCSA